MFHFISLLLLALILFLCGFFPISNNTANFNNDPPTHIGNLSINLSKTYRPHFTKTVLYVIDALRWDFITPELMPLTVKHMNKKGCLSKVIVESPTVTLPRIKALTTGSIPQYIDVVRNLASSEILQDSWLHSAKKKGLKTVFYGDNTWEKLFPDFFTRSEGTTSFFVWDFSEVDDNVTRNVNLELEQKDWDIMILHYLGLDHIGHVLGPFSSRMPLKLKEMDEVINKIYEKTDDGTLIFITGDHGMRDSGGHGGTTHPEVTVPLITIGLDCQNSSFLQTDIPANLAVLLGLNIPSTSIGKIQKLFLSNLNIQEYLYALKYNTELLLKKNNFCIDHFKNATFFHEEFLKSGNTKHANVAMELYQDCSGNITKELYEASSKQHMTSLYIAILVMLNVLAMTLQHLLAVKYQSNLLKMLICTVIIFLQFFKNFDQSFTLYSGILLILFIFEIRKLLENLNMKIFESSLSCFLILTCVLHPITFISTSFIEEEHYYWIYFSVTLIFLIIVQLLREKKGILNKSIVKLILVLVFIRFSMDLNSTLENSVQNTDNWANLLIEEQNRLYHQIFFAFSLILVFFVIYYDLGVSKNTPIPCILLLVTLFLIFLLKSTTYHNTFLGKLLWALIFLQKACFKETSWKLTWIQASTLLIKPHNVILIPFAVYTGREICTRVNFRYKSISALAIASYILSNCFYFLQGHRNSLASVDISIGYTGLNDYYPILVISQVLIHTYSFPVLFHLTALCDISKVKDQKQYWLTMVALRSSVVMFTSLMMIVFRHHLFIWSVFAPKFFIECVHTAFLFIEIFFWYLYNYFKKLFRHKYVLF